MEKTKQKQEAIERMKMLKLHGNIIREFEKEGIVNLSENGGFLFWLDNDQQAIVLKNEFYNATATTTANRTKKSLTL